jgi:ATP-binding cassette, subfamily C (CFTR/MRP), member 1
MLAQVKCFWRPNVYVLVPRFIFIVLRCCQPLLISRAIAFVSEDLSPFENRNEAFRLILLTFVIYVGMAVRLVIEEIFYMHRMFLIPTS